MTPVTSNRISPSALAVLDSYAETVLTCPPSLARGGGVHILVDPRRGLPAWHGYVLPIVGLAFAPGAVIACRPDLLDTFRGHLGSDAHQSYLDGPAFRRLWRAVQKSAAHAFTLAGDLRVVDAGTFRQSNSTDRAELIADDDPAGLELRARFDGAIFAIRGPQGRLISWAALKLKSDTVWEIAVATESEYRGRGYARDVVSAATRHVLQHGRVAIYIHDRDNTTSAYVARALGYQLYSEIVFAEY